VPALSYIIRQLRRVLLVRRLAVLVRRLAVLVRLLVALAVHSLPDT
jgi:hypothetical protein